MKKFIRGHLFYVIVILISVLSFTALFNPGFFPIHDDEQVGRLFELNYSLESGHFPPRISQNLGFGYGYPFFNFYPSFVYYVAEVFVLTGFGYISSIKIMIALGFILSGVFMFLFSKEYLGKYGGLLAATLYIYAPYHSVDVYVRGALPEFWSFVFIPLIFWSLKKLSETNENKYLILMSISSAMLVLTHNLVAMMSGIFIFIYVVFLSLFLKNKKEFYFKFILSGLLALSFSAYFWIPSFFERKFTMIELLTSELADYRQHFIYLKQFWNSPWGFGGSGYGINDGMSFQIGKLNIILTITTISLIIIRFLEKKKIDYVLILFILLCAISIFIQTEYSKFIWDNLKTFSYIQFPWRFMLFTVFTTSFIGAYFLNFIKSEKIKVIITVILIMICILSSYKFFNPRIFLTDYTDENYINTDFIKWNTSILAFEYVPNGIGTKTGVFGNTVIDISSDEISKASHEVISGDMNIETITNLPHRKEFRVNVFNSGQFQINTYSFPGWKVYVNGKKIEYKDNNKLKLIRFNLDEGKHEIKAEFTDTNPRLIGNLLTFISVLGIIILSVWFRIKK